jgi:7,8-dihydroneopterin 2',3'-cyclic phosphate phosphodiesterase
MLHLRIASLTQRIRDKKLRQKVTELLEKTEIEIGGKKYTPLPVGISPAAQRRHHAYEGGYVEHVVSTANIAMALCDSVEEVYHGKVNRDLVLAGILLHDALKPYTYSINECGNYEATQLANYLDHLSLATAELIRTDFPIELVHIVAAHYGEYGPVRPRTVEALVCHLADLADSRLNGEVLSAAAYLTRKATGEELQNMNSKEAFEIVRSKALEGWKGVSETVGSLKRRRGRKT